MSQAEPSMIDRSIKQLTIKKYGQVWQKLRNSGKKDTELKESKLPTRQHNHMGSEKSQEILRI